MNRLKERYLKEVKDSKSDYLLTKNEYGKIQRRISSFEEEMKES